MYLLVDLGQKPLSGVVAQVELLSEFVYDLVGVIIFENAYLFHILAVKLNLEYADGLFDYWEISRHIFLWCVATWSHVRLHSSDIVGIILNFGCVRRRPTLVIYSHFLSGRLQTVRKFCRRLRIRGLLDGLEILLLQLFECLGLLLIEILRDRWRLVISIRESRVHRRLERTLLLRLFKLQLFRIFVESLILVDVLVQNAV